MSSSDQLATIWTRLPNEATQSTASKPRPTSFRASDPPHPQHTNHHQQNQNHNHNQLQHHPSPSSFPGELDRSPRSSVSSASNTPPSTASSAQGKGGLPLPGGLYLDPNRSPKSSTALPPLSSSNTTTATSASSLRLSPHSPLSLGLYPSDCLVLGGGVGVAGGAGSGSGVGGVFSGLAFLTGRERDFGVHSFNPSATPYNHISNSSLTTVEPISGVSASGAGPGFDTTGSSPTGGNASLHRSPPPPYSSGNRQQPSLAPHPVSATSSSSGVIQSSSTGPDKERTQDALADIFAGNLRPHYRSSSLSQQQSYQQQHHHNGFTSPQLDSVLSATGDESSSRSYFSPQPARPFIRNRSLSSAPVLDHHPHTTDLMSQHAASGGPYGGGSNYVNNRAPPAPLGPQSTSSLLGQLNQSSSSLQQHHQHQDPTSPLISTSTDDLSSVRPSLSQFGSQSFSGAYEQHNGGFGRGSGVGYGSPAQSSPSIGGGGYDITGWRNGASSTIANNNNNNNNTLSSSSTMTANLNPQSSPLHWDDLDREGRSRRRDDVSQQHPWEPRESSVGGSSTGTGIGLSNMSPFTRDGRILTSDFSDPNGGMMTGASVYKTRREYSLGAVGSGRKRGESVWGSSRTLREAENEDSDDAFVPPTKSGMSSRRHSFAAFNNPPSRSQIGFNLPEEDRHLKASPTSNGHTAFSSSVGGVGGGGGGENDGDIDSGRRSYSRNGGSNGSLALRNLATSGSSTLSDDDLALNLNSLHLNLEAHAHATANTAVMGSSPTDRTRGDEGDSRSSPYVGSMPLDFSHQQHDQRRYLDEESSSQSKSPPPIGTRRLEPSGFTTGSGGPPNTRNTSRFEFGSPGGGGGGGGTGNNSGVGMHLQGNNTSGSSGFGYPNQGTLPKGNLSGLPTSSSSSSSPYFSGNSSLDTGSLPNLPHSSHHYSYQQQQQQQHQQQQPQNTGYRMGQGPPNSYSTAHTSQHPQQQQQPMAHNSMGGQYSTNLGGLPMVPAPPPPPHLSPSLLTPPLPSLASASAATATSSTSGEMSNLGRGTPLHAVPANAPLYIVEFKAGRKDLFFVPDPTLQLRQGDLVIVEADRGKDIGKFFKPCSLEEVQGFQQRLVEMALGQLANPNPSSSSQSMGGSGSNVSGGSLHHGGLGGVSLGSPNLNSSSSSSSSIPNAAALARMTKEFAPKKIFGKAQPVDTHMLLSKAQDEVKALALVRNKVAQKNLAMEVCDAEWQWDRRKLTFYYIADSRVDFRELVRELFRLYKTRIWMCCLDQQASTWDFK